MPYIVRETRPNGSTLFLHRKLGSGYFLSPSKKGVAKWQDQDSAASAALSHYAFSPSAKYVKIVQVK